MMRLFRQFLLRFGMLVVLGHFKDISVFNLFVTVTATNETKRMEIVDSSLRLYLFLSPWIFNNLLTSKSWNKTKIARLKGLNFDPHWYDLSNQFLRRNCVSGRWILRNSELICLIKIVVSSILMKDCDCLGDTGSLTVTKVLNFVFS